MQFRKNAEGRYGKQIARLKAEGVTLSYAMLQNRKKLFFWP